MDTWVYYPQQKGSDEMTSENFTKLETEIIRNVREGLRTKAELKSCNCYYCEKVLKYLNREL